MVTRSIRFEDSLYEALDNAADDRRVSFNWLVNQLCREGIERLTEEFKVTS
jgi:predicted DNA-binding ribbon-helix-helix protein